jgi:GNAT superfamily N-acetyltransferase
MGAEGDLVASRLARGCRCFGAWLGEELVGYGWLSTGPEWIGELDMEIAPRSHQAYIWNCVTFHPHRRQGVFGAVVASLVAQARREGLARVWIAALADLANSAVVRAGFVRVVSFHTIPGWWFRWLTVRPEANVDPGLIAAACEAMAIRPGSSLRRSRHRRH